MWTMRRRVFPFVCAAVVLLPALRLAAGTLAAGERPNVILCLADDLGYADVGYQGSRLAVTPQIDRMAHCSLVFRRFYAAAPVCSPTRGSCLTGRHPFRYGVFSANVGHLPEDEPNLAVLLKKAGYRTGHFGKWHLGTLTTEVRDAYRGQPGETSHFAPPWKRGFDVCFSAEAKVPTYNPMVRPRDFSNHPGNLQHWWNPQIEPDNAMHYGTRYWNERGEEVADNLDGPDARVIMDRVIPFIEESVKQERPFFAVVWFHEPHWPVVAGRDHTQRFSELSPHAQHYYGCILAMDDQIGRLRRALRRLGVADNTMIWFASDNGPEGGPAMPGSTGGLRGRKRDLYEGGIRVPGLLEWPARIRQGRVTDVPAVTSDYLPTIAEVLGIALPDDRPIDGVSLVPLIEGRMNERPRPIAFQWQGRTALIDNRYKLVHYGSGGPFARPPWRWELYDLIEDGAESTNLAKEHPEIVEQMSGELQQWNESVQNCLGRLQRQPL